MTKEAEKFKFTRFSLDSEPIVSMVYEFRAVSNRSPYFVFVPTVRNFF